MKIKKILQNIFSIRNTDRHKLITIFGIKFRIKSKFNELKFELNEAVNFFYGQLRNDLYSVMRFSGGDAFKRERMEIGEKEHQRNVEKLLENLDANARYNCEKCLKKQNKIFYQDTILLNDIYSSDELAQIEKIHHFKRSVTKENGYYQCLSYKLPINFFETSVFFHKLGLDHIKNKNYVKNKTIIDVGAYIADSCLVLRTEFPHENIIGFEPIKNNYNLAFETIKLNQLKNIKMENYALGDNCGFVNMQFAGTEGEASQTVPLETLSNDNVVEMLTLDEYVKQNKSGVNKSRY